MLFVTSDVVYGISFIVTVVAVVLVLSEEEVVSSVVDEDSSEVEVVSEVALSELAHEFIFRLKKKTSKINIITSFRFEIFFNEKEISTLSNPNTINKNSHFGMMDRSLEFCW